MGQVREMLNSRLGFLMLAAGCAVGLGNVWRFPFVAGQYGGGAFVMIYLVFLVLLGAPVMVMELAIGRASQLDLVGAARVLPKKRFWRAPAFLFFSGNLLLIMFYTVVTGWMLAYVWSFLSGELPAPDQAPKVFSGLLANPGAMIRWTLVTTLIVACICGVGIRRGVERCVKWMMLALFLMLLILGIRSFWLSGFASGVGFYLKPDFVRLYEAGIGSAVMAAMGQAFFTLGLGIGSMALVGSYTDRRRSLSQETAVIITLDTVVAMMAGLVIFPACFSYSIAPNQGPGLIFLTLPEVFANMVGGRWWGALFFAFMCMAALTTVIVFFETLVTYLIDEWRIRRSRAVAGIFVTVLVTTLPCIFGFNLWSGIQPLGQGSNILDLEDFIVSDNLLPLGSGFMILFCSLKSGWGWKNFTAEANTGDGFHFPSWAQFYVRWILPLIILAIFFFGYRERFLG